MVGGLILLGFVVLDVVILWCGCGFLRGKRGQEDGVILWWKERQEPASWEFCFPPIARSAMDGAPERFCPSENLYPKGGM